MEYTLPNTLANWPWPRRVNPHYDTIAPVSAAWVESFRAMSPSAQKAFNACKFGLLAAMFYPAADEKKYRRGCDLQNVFFIIEEFTDTQKGEEVQHVVDIVMDTLRNPHEPRPEGELLIGKIIQEFWLLAIEDTSEVWQDRFIDTFQRYMDSNYRQASDRDVGHIRDLETYMEWRRENIGVWPTIVLYELDSDLPPEIYDHPLVQEICIDATDLVIIDNDIVSYNVEQARGDTHNILCVVMNELSLDLQDALDWTAKKHQEIASAFLSKLAALPSFGEDYDRKLKSYISAVAQVVTAGGHWSFECERYFGKAGMQIQKHRKFVLLPKKK
ncbi:hypothetical protein NLI96_g902 [Meripilus lineatus]|uniref:Terpene synthase n=1 Tax=Meripilus lineatus TaxID=2056292 RepID=A0AAD5VBH2_9APHY|nr:hypothetical protein NLI96_g902 [Physisporinus lineatus]